MHVHDVRKGVEGGLLSGQQIDLELVLDLWTYGTKGDVNNVAALGALQQTVLKLIDAGSESLSMKFASARRS